MSDAEVERYCAFGVMFSAFMAMAFMATLMVI